MRHTIAIRESLTTLLYCYCDLIDVYSRRPLHARTLHQALQTTRGENFVELPSPLVVQCKNRILIQKIGLLLINLASILTDNQRTRGLWGY
jgi:hypothetical protein